MTDWTKERIAEARRICEAATPGPWEWDLDGDLVARGGVKVVYEDVSVSEYNEIVAASIEANILDQSFIAHARTAYPAALDEIERYRARIAELEGVIENAMDFIETDERLNGESRDYTLYSSLHDIVSQGLPPEIEAELEDDQCLNQ